MGEFFSIKEDRPMPTTSDAKTKPAADTAKTKRNGGEIIVESLLREGVEVVFGIPGGAFLPTYDVLPKYSKLLNHVLVAHEQGGAHAAEGYARASGKVGVCFATSGPGATNLVTGIADARMDSVPMVAITAQVTGSLIGSDAFQETDIVGITRSITKHNYLVKRTEDLARVIKEAFHIASTGRPGPVLVDIPKDVQQNKIVPEYPDSVNMRGYHPDVKMDFSQIERAAEAISKAKRPCLYVGGGVISGEASAELFEFATKANIPVTTTMMGIGAFPETNSLSLKWPGMHGAVYATFAINQADVLIAVGARFDDRVTGKLSEFAREATIIHIDIDASEINKNKIAHIPIQAHVKDALKALIPLVEPGDYKEWHETIAKWKKQFPFYYEHSDSVIKAQWAIEKLYDVTEGKAVIATGVGQHQMWTGQFYTFTKPRTFISSLGLATMGFGLPAAIGAQYALPNQLVIDVDGDGSFLMTCHELCTIGRQGLPVKVLLLNNHHLGMVRQWQDDFYAQNYCATYLGKNNDMDYPNYAHIAEGFGIPNKRISKPGELVKAMEEMVSFNGPYVLEVMVNPKEKVLPIVPPGASWQDVVYKASDLEARFRK